MRTFLLLITVWSALWAPSVSGQGQMYPLPFEFDKPVLSGNIGNNGSTEVIIGSGILNNQYDNFKYQFEMVDYSVTTLPTISVPPTQVKAITAIPIEVVADNRRFILLGLPSYEENGDRYNSYPESPGRVISYVADAEWNYDGLDPWGKAGFSYWGRRPYSGFGNSLAAGAYMYANNTLMYFIGASKDDPGVITLSDCGYVYYSSEWPGDPIIRDSQGSYYNDRLRALQSPNPEKDGNYGASIAVISGTPQNPTGTLFVGAPGEDGKRGRVYAYRGQEPWTSGQHPFSAPVVLSSPIDESTHPYNQVFGTEIAVIPDCTQDGVNDILISSPGKLIPGFVWSDSYQGAVYLYDGQTLELLEIITANDAAERYVGYDIAAFPDINGDGCGDFAIQVLVDSETIFSRTYLFSGKTRQPLCDPMENSGFDLYGLQDITEDNLGELYFKHDSQGSQILHLSPLPDIPIERKSAISHDAWSRYR